MKTIRLIALSLSLMLAPVFVSPVLAQDEDTTEATPPKKEKKEKAKKEKKFAFKMEKKGYKRIMKKAKAAGVPVMVLFTNPATCPYCVKLEEEVLDTNEWKKGVAGKLMCLYVDSQNKERKELSQKYAHGGIPTFFIVDPIDEKVIGQGGYSGSNVSAYVAAIDRAYKTVHDKAAEAKEAAAGEKEK